MKDFEIIEMYNNGYSPKEICDRLNCSVGTIYNALKRNGVNTRNHCKGITTEMRNDVINRYTNNQSVFYISKEMGIHQAKINKILNEAGIERISAAKRMNPNFAECYFENIDTPEKAYWLGWLITDGCISDTSISISLQSRDKYILKLFEEDLGLENKIKKFNGKYDRLYFCSKKMTNDLKKYGIIQNKTFSVTIPDLDDNLYPHILRGCLDGDGSLLFMNSRGKYEYELSFTGNVECVNRFNLLVSKICGTSIKNVTKNGTIYRVRWSNKDEIVKICNILYNECGIHMLSRKYDKYVEIINS